MGGVADGVVITMAGDRGARVRRAREGEQEEEKEEEEEERRRRG